MLRRSGLYVFPDGRPEYVVRAPETVSGIRFQDRSGDDVGLTSVDSLGFQPFFHLIDRILVAPPDSVARWAISGCFSGLFEPIIRDLKAFTDLLGH